MRRAGGRSVTAMQKYTGMPRLLGEDNRQERIEECEDGIRKLNILLQAKYEEAEKLNANLQGNTREVQQLRASL